MDVEACDPRPPGNKSGHFGQFFLLGGALFGGRLQCGENDGGGLLDHFKALGEKGSVAVVERYVVRRSAAGLQSYGLAYNESNGLSLGFADCLGGGAAPLCL